MLIKLKWMTTLILGSSLVLASCSDTADAPTRQENANIQGACQDQSLYVQGYQTGTTASNRVNGQFGLCDLQKRSQADVLVMLVTNPTCTTCQEKIRELDQVLKSRSDLDTRLAVTMVLQEDDYVRDTNKIESFYRIAPGTIPLVDLEARMTSQIVASPVFPIFLVIGDGGFETFTNYEEIVQNGFVRNTLLQTIERFGQ